MKKYLFCRVIFALIGTAAVLWAISALFTFRSFPVQGHLTLDDAENSVVYCAFGREGGAWSRAGKFSSDPDGNVIIDTIFFADAPRLFKVETEKKSSVMKIVRLAVSNADTAKWQVLRGSDDNKNSSVIFRIPEDVCGTLEINWLVFVSASVVLFAFFYFISSRIQIEKEEYGVFFADGIFVFGVVIFLFIPASNINKDDVLISEKRKLAEFPAFFTEGRVNRAFGREVDAFFNDRFFLRDEFLQLNQLISVFTGNDFRHAGKVITGRDNWYFYARNNAVRNYHNLDVFSNEELEKFAGDVQFINTLCSRSGKKLYIFIVPDKHKIYGEYFPAAEKIYPDSASRAEQLVSFLKKNSSVPIHYFYDDLHAAKKDALLYWKNDTHWNSYGAYIAVRKIVEIIRKDHPDIAEIDLPVTYQKTDWRGDLSPLSADILYPFVRMQKNYTSDSADSGRAFVNFSTFSAQGKHKLFFVRDSFAEQELPLLGNIFASIRALWSDYVVERSEIEHFKKADIVIFQCAERLLVQFTEGVHQTRVNLEKELE